MFVQNSVFTADTVHVDGIQLSSSLINQINWFQTIHDLPSAKQGMNAFVHMHYYYRGKNPNNPDVGDTRVHFQCAGVSQGSTTSSPDKVSSFYCVSSFSLKCAAHVVAAEPMDHLKT